MQIRNLFITGNFLDRKTIVLHNVMDNDTVLNVKQQIEEKEKLPAEYQSLYFAGKKLKNDYQLNQYGNDLSDSTFRMYLRVPKNSTIHMTKLFNKCQI